MCNHKIYATQDELDESFEFEGRNPEQNIWIDVSDDFYEKTWMCPRCLETVRIRKDYCPKCGTPLLKL